MYSATEGPATGYNTGSHRGNTDDELVAADCRMNEAGSMEENPYQSPPGETALPATAPVIEPPQSITYATRVQDTLAAWDFCYRDSPPWRSQVQGDFRIATMAAVAMLTIGLLTSTFEAALLAFGGGATLLLGILLRVPVRKRYYRRQSEAMFLRDYPSGVSNPETMTLLEDRLRVEGEQGKNELYWQAVFRASSDDQLLLIYAQDGSRWGVPRHAFANGAAFVSFCDLAKRLWQASPSR